MKIGLKLWSSNTNVLPKASYLIENGFFDFIELTYEPATIIEPFTDYDIDYVLHLPTEYMGFNIGDESKIEENIDVLEKCSVVADKLNSNSIIIHPGYGNPLSIIDFLDRTGEKRMLFENMPAVGLKGEHMLGYSPKQISDIINYKKMGFCLDFGHAIKAAYSLGLGYKEFINDLMNLKPTIFHLCDGFVSSEVDEHLPIGNGDYDFAFIRSSITDENAMITMETPKENTTSLADDMKNRKELKKRGF